MKKRFGAKMMKQDMDMGGSDAMGMIKKAKKKKKASKYAGMLK